MERFHRFPVVIAAKSHPIPSRTRKLSSPAPMVLHGRPCGRVGRRRIFLGSPRPYGRGLRLFGPRERALASTSADRASSEARGPKPNSRPLLATSLSPKQVSRFGSRSFVGWFVSSRKKSCAANNRIAAERVAQQSAALRRAWAHEEAGFDQAADRKMVAPGDEPVAKTGPSLRRVFSTLRASAREKCACFAVALESRLECLGEIFSGDLDVGARAIVG